MVVVFALLLLTFEFERDEVFAPEVVLEAESAVELAFARHAGGGVGISLKDTLII